MAVPFQVFLSDDRGITLSVEHILVATIVMLGSIVGLSSFRDTIVQEFGDVSAAASGLNHTYRLNGISFRDTIEHVETTFEVMGSAYTDELNFCEPSDPDPAGGSPMCIEITRELTLNEGAPLP